MSAGRKRKKAARQQPVAQWRASATVLPPRARAPRNPHPNGATAATAATPVTRSDAVEEPIAPPPPQDAAPPPAAQESGQAASPPEELADPAEPPPQRTSNLARALPDARDDLAAPRPNPLADQYDWEHQFWDDHGGRYAAQDLGEDDAASRRGRRRRAIAVAVGAPLLFVAGFAASGWIIGAVRDKPSVAVQTVAPLPTTSSPTTPLTAPISGASAYAPGLPAGPGQTEPGVLVRASPSADGSLEVLERVRFADPVTELSLAPPLTKGVAAKSRPTHIEVTDLQVQADDAVVDIGARSLTKARTVELPAGTGTVVMRYRLTGATIRSVPSTPGRALAVLPPITSAATLGSTPFVIEVSGAQVTNVLCPGLPTAAQLCGRTWARGWYLAPQRPGRTAVLAQLTLPDPVSS